MRCAPIPAEQEPSLHEFLNLQIERLREKQRQAAAGQFERAKEVIASGNFEYGIHLLLSCCKLDPANLAYRRVLRKELAHV